jgi:putative tricarboxylic transport membrane protein
VFGLASIGVFLADDTVKGLFAACFGLFVGYVGRDPVNGYERLMFGYIELSDGIPFLTVLVGMYALPPAWQMAERALQDGVSKEDLEFKSDGGLKLWPWREIIPAWIRSSVIGVIIGILPGVGGVAASVPAYNEVKRVAKDPDSFGQGNPVGVAAAECSNSADNAASMIPALTLGVPGSGPAALMLGALLVIGVQPGPDLFKESPKLVFGYMWAMFATAVLLIPIGGLIATKLFANVLRVPPVLLAPVIMSLTALGIYAFAGQMFFVWIMFAFGFIGYVFEKMSIPPAPVIMGLLLGPKAEASLRISLNISFGEWSVLWTRPISQFLIVLVVLVIAYPMVRALLKKRMT